MHSSVTDLHLDATTINVDGTFPSDRSESPKTKDDTIQEVAHATNIDKIILIINTMALLLTNLLTGAAPRDERSNANTGYGAVSGAAAR